MDMSLGNLSNINGWWSFHIYIYIYIYIYIQRLPATTRWVAGSRSLESIWHVQVREMRRTWQWRIPPFIDVFSIKGSKFWCGFSQLAISHVGRHRRSTAFNPIGHGRSSRRRQMRRTCGIWPGIPAPSPQNLWWSAWRKALGARVSRLHRGNQVAPMGGVSFWQNHGTIFGFLGLRSDS